MQVKGSREGTIYIHGLITAEIDAGIDTGSIFVGGFGMGAAMALCAVLTYRNARGSGLGGYVGLSGWLPLKGVADMVCEKYNDGDHAEANSDDEDEDVFPALNSAFKIELGMTLRGPPTVSRLDGIPFFFGHGQADEEISVDLASSAAKVLEDIGLNVTMKAYADLGHEWRIGDEMDDVTSFLASHGLG